MMNILNIHAYPGMQNAARPAGENSAALSRSPGSSSDDIGSTRSPGDKGLIPWPSLSVTAQIDRLQQHVEGNLNIVRDPPFFPIATYQRADLVKRVRIIEEQVQRLGLEKSNIKVTFSAEPLKEKATDKDLAAALDKLFAVRDRLKSSEPPAPPKDIKPGAILAVEV